VAVSLWLSVLAWDCCLADAPQPANPFEKRKELRGPSGPVLQVRFSQSAQFLASTNGDSVLLWSIHAGKALCEIKTSFVAGIDFLSTGDDLVYGNSQGVFVFDRKKACLQRGIQRKGGIAAISASSDRNFIAFSTDEVVEVWDLRNKAASRTFKCGATFVDSITWSSDSKVIALAEREGTVSLWNVETRKRIKSLRGLVRTDYLRSLFFVNDRLLLGACSRDHIVLWDINSGKLVADLADSEDAGQFLTFAYEPRSAILAIGCEKRIRFVHSLSQKKLGTWNAPLHVGSLAFAPDGKQLSVGYGDISGGSDDPANLGIIHIIPCDLDRMLREK
jgi:WD40 repeat protein